MTFTFTLDAFPDYTKFKKTKKVLAALQVITEDVDSADDVREACAPVQVEAMGGVTITFDDIGTTDMVKMTATGYDIDGKSDNSYNKDTSVFGDLTDKGEFAQVTLHFNDLKADEEYTVIQNNPALKTAYPSGGGGIEGETKTKSYRGDALAEGYDLLLGEKPGLVTAKIQDAKKNTLQIIQINNKVNFVKRNKVTINDSGSKIEAGSYRVGEEGEAVTPVGGVITVIYGKTLCFKTTEDATVKANGKTIQPDAAGIYTVKVIGDTNITVF